MDELALYLIGPVLGFTLRMSGTLCLHASAVAIGELAIAIAGPSGAGKSTTAAAFVKMGYPVLSDDILPLELKPHQLLVSPGYPRLRLWPDAARHLHGDENSLPQLLPDWEKRYLDLSGNIHMFHGKPLPLGAIYILDSRIAADTPEINELAGTEAILALVKNTYRNELLSISMRAQEFNAINKVVSLIPIRHVQPPMDLKNISMLCDAIIEDLSSIITTPHSDAL